uniref:Tape measure protein N-terminal domain-containing protein n=1 Tax=Synechococcus phage S-CAM8 TaxID=754038 RepID=G8EY07_9CAUD
MANNETVLKIRAEIENLQGLNQLKTALRKSSAEAKGADNDFRGLVQKVRELQAASVKSINNLNAQRDAFEALRRSADVTSKEFKEARDEIEKIDRALKEASGTVVKYSKNSINALRAQKNELLAVRDSADLMSKEFKEAGIELAKLDKKLAKAEGRGRGGRLRAGAQIAGTVAGAGVFGGPEGAIGALGGGLIGGVGGAVLGGALGAQVGQLRKAAGGVAEYVAELNLAKGALGGVSKDIVEYNQNLDFAREISKKYAIRLTDVIKGYTGVTAAAKANNLTVKQTQAIYEGITVSGVAAGKSQEDLQALFLATTQVLSKGKASAEEISGQIGERIPGAVAKFAAANKISLQELAEQFKKGEVTIAKFVRFTEQQGEDYAEVAEALASGPEKAGVRLQIALDEASEAYGGFFLKTGAGFQDYLTNLVNFVIKNQDQFKLLIAQTVVFAQDFVSIFVNIGEAIWDVFGPLFELIGNTLKGFIDATADVLRQGQVERAARKQGIDTFAVRREAEADIVAEDGGRNMFTQGDRISQRYTQLLAEKTGLNAAGDSRKARIDAIRKTFDGYLPPKFAGPNTITPPTGDLDGDGKLSGGSDIDKALRARNAALKLSEILDRQLRDISLKTKGIGASAEQAIENKFSEAFNKAVDKTDDLRTKLAKYEAEAGQAFPGITDKINELESALVDAADAQKKLAMQELADKRFGEKLKSYGFTGEALDAGGKIFATGALDQQAFPTGIDSILNPSKITVAIQELKKGLEELTNPANQVIGAATAIGTAFSDSFKSVLDGTSTTQEALAGFFKNIASYFLDMAVQIIQKMITMYILNTVVRLLPGLGSGGSGFNLGGFGSLSSDSVSGASGFLNAASINAASISPFAKGGIVNKPTMFAYANGGAGRFGLMGEAGPEAILPLSRGANGKLGVQASGGGGVSVGNINITVENTGDQLNPAAQKQLAGQVQGIVLSTLANERRSGGML